MTERLDNATESVGHSIQSAGRVPKPRPLCGVCRKRPVRMNTIAGRCDACRKYVERHGYDRPPDGYEYRT
jgi:hypothetical protein